MNKYLLLSFIKAILVTYVENFPLFNAAMEVQNFAMKFGYMTKSPSTLKMASPVDPDLKDAIIMIQNMAGLPEDGFINGELLNYIRKRRCGNPDYGSLKISVNRRKRFAVDGQTTKWAKRHLTYSVNYTNIPVLSETEVDTFLAHAFRVWSNHTTLVFVPSVCSNPDIEFSFHVGDHGDGAPFDGPGGVFAHAFLPYDMGNCSVCGWVHFDAEETWATRDGNGDLQNNIFYEIAAHELGHTLGLLHTNVSGALMQPQLQLLDFDQVRLHPDDIAGIQSLYGDKDTIYNEADQTDICPPRSCIKKIPGDLTTPCLLTEPTTTTSTSRSTTSTSRSTTSTSRSTTSTSTTSTTTLLTSTLSTTSTITAPTRTITTSTTTEDVEPTNTTISILFEDDLSDETSELYDDTEYVLISDEFSDFS